MLALNADTLLNWWETGATRPPVQRCWHLLCAAWPDRPAEEWAQATMGRRDEALLRLREGLFGSRLDTVAECPGCGAALEMSFGTDAIRATPEAARQDDQIELEDYRVHYRPPTTADLLATFERDAQAAPRDVLLRRCIVSATHAGRAIDVTEFPPALLAALQDGMARLDPQAAVAVETTCPACEKVSRFDFDIAAYLWDEIGDWAVRTLREVHTLAQAYSWHERDILAMSARRRRHYLDLLGA